MTRVRVPAAAAALLGCSSELQPEGFDGDSYFDRHLEEESHFFSLSLPSRSIFILAESALEKKLWMVGIHALLSGQARDLPELEDHIDSHLPPWIVSGLEDLGEANDGSEAGEERSRSGCDQRPVSRSQQQGKERSTFEAKKGSTF